MNRLLAIKNQDDIPEEFRNTPIGHLLSYHNLKAPHQSYKQAELLVGMCMDNRKKLDLPNNFAFIIRSGGANLHFSEFYISYAIAVGGVKHMALIGHTQCGMVNLNARREAFVKGLSENAGWDSKEAEEHFIHESAVFEIGNEIDFILSETKHLAERYPKIKIAPLIYKVEDNLLYWIESTS